MSEPLTKEERKAIAYNAREILGDRITLAPTREDTAKTILQYEATCVALETRWQVGRIMALEADLAVALADCRTLAKLAEVPPRVWRGKDGMPDEAAWRDAVHRRDFYLRESERLARPLSGERHP